MADEKKTSKQPPAQKGMLPEKQRGTQDDVEVIKLILDENPALRQRVLDRIKAVRKMNKL
ncbi:hypothetical protein EBZ80_14460 [bacterium]|nr:hypothetical protein [bacterium]